MWLRPFQPYDAAVRYQHCGQAGPASTAATLVGSVLQAPHPPSQGTLGPPGGSSPGTRDRHREGRSRGEATQLRDPQVRQGPIDQEWPPGDRLRRRGRGDQLHRRARRGDGRGYWRTHGPFLRGYPRGPLQGHPGERHLARRAGPRSEGEGATMSDGPESYRPREEPIDEGDSGPAIQRPAAPPAPTLPIPPPLR